MNKKVLLVVWSLSSAIFLGSLIFSLIALVLSVDGIFGYEIMGILFTLSSLLILAIIQFSIVSLILHLYTLAKLWGAIQDAHSEVSVGKAIGFLFIPVFSLYWIFRVWGGYPNDYNKFAERHNLSVPRLSSQMFAANPVFQLLTGIFILPIIILPFVFAAVLADAADAVNNLEDAKRSKIESQFAGMHAIPPVYRERKGFSRFMMAGGAFAGILVLFLAVIALLAVTSSKASPTADEAPPTVGKYKLDGNAFGQKSLLRTAKIFWGIKYKNEQASQIVYDYHSYLLEGAAVRQINSYHYCRDEKTKFEGQLKDKSGNEAGNFWSCDNRIWVRNGKIVTSIRAESYSGTTVAPWEDVIEFVKNLPFLKSLDLSPIEKTSASTATSDTASTATQTTETPAVETDKTADLTVTAVEFAMEADDTDKWKAGLAKYKGKTVEISGRAYLFKPFDGKELFFRTLSGSLKLELGQSQSGKLANLQEDDRIRLKCRVAGDYKAELKGCAVLEKKPPVIADEKADMSISAKQYYDEVADYNLDYEKQKKNREKYFGKIIEISGTVKKIGSDNHFLDVAGNNFVTCNPSPTAKSQFSGLTEGQEVKFKATDDGISLKHCVISR